MTLATPWKTYSEFETDRHGAEHENDPEIFVSHDRRCVWVKFQNRDDNTLRMATTAEISELWDRFRLITLLSVLRVVDSSILNAQDAAGSISLEY